MTKPIVNCGSPFTYFKAQICPIKTLRSPICVLTSLAGLCRLYKEEKKNKRV